MTKALASFKKKKKRLSSIFFMTNADLFVPLPTRIRGSCNYTIKPAWWGTQQGPCTLWGDVFQGR